MTFHLTVLERDSSLADAPESPVMTHNEWDPLEEVIVGRLEGATIPSNHVTVTFDLPPLARKLYRIAAGYRYPTMDGEARAKGARWPSSPSSKARA